MHSLLNADIDAKPTLASKLDATSDAAAAVTVAANAEQFWVLDWVGWSYVGGTVTGKLTIAINSVTVYEVDIATAGEDFINFYPPLYTGVKNQALVVTLGAGGTGVTGKLNIRYR